MQFSAAEALALALGLGLGAINWVFWSKWTKRWLDKKSLKKNAFVGLSVIKFTLLSLVIWLLLSLGLEPIGFLIGLSLVTVGILFKGAHFA